MLALSSYSTPAQVALRLRGVGRWEESSFIALTGLEAEPRFCQWYSNRFAVDVHKVDPVEGDWWRASPDGIASNGVGVEIKNWDPIRRREFGMPETDEVPVQLTLQCQWYMHWLGWERMHAIVGFGTREPVVYALESDRVLQERIVRFARTFYERALTENPFEFPVIEQPEPVGTPLGPLDVIAPFSDIEQARLMVEAQKQAKKAKQALDTYKKWALDRLNYNKGTIDTPVAKVTVYPYKDALAVKVTEKK